MFDWNVKLLLIVGQKCNNKFTHTFWYFEIRLMYVVLKMHFEFAGFWVVDPALVAFAWFTKLKAWERSLTLSLRKVLSVSAGSSILLSEQALQFCFRICRRICDTVLHRIWGPNDMKQFVLQKELWHQISDYSPCSSIIFATLVHIIPVHFLEL